jgi:putative phosphoesterase
MRILVVSDIHGNLPALSAIDEPYDVCISLGDLVDYGPDPAPCVRWAMEHANYAIRGNHDHGVAQGIPGFGDTGYRYLTKVTRPLMWDLLEADERRYLLQLPVTQRVTLDGLKFLLVHATPRDPLDEYVLKDPKTWARRLKNVDADIVCVGHSHMQFNLMVDDVVVLNPGSVGQPRDGDPRAAYAIIEDNRIELKRVEYPVEKAVERIEAFPIPERARSLLSHSLRHGKLPDPEPSNAEANGDAE